MNDDQTSPTSSEGEVSYVVRHGRRIEVVTIKPDVAPPKRRKSFEPIWVKLPRHWVSALGQSRSANTYRLALLILMEEYRNKRGGKIPLSTQMTGMPGNTRRRAARELVKLKLITLEAVKGAETTNGAKVLKATIIHHNYYRERREKKEEEGVCAPRVAHRVADGMCAIDGADDQAVRG